MMSMLREAWMKTSRELTVIRELFMPWKWILSRFHLYDVKQLCLVHKLFLSRSPLDFLTTELFYAKLINLNEACVAVTPLKSDYMTGRHL